jgi:hypothetical protein
MEYVFMQYHPVYFSVRNTVEDVSENVQGEGMNKAWIRKRLNSGEK